MAGISAAAGSFDACEKLLEALSPENAIAFIIKIRGTANQVWRTVDQHGVVRDILVQVRRDGAAALHLFKRLIHGLPYRPKRVITDDLHSYGLARRAPLARYPEAVDEGALQQGDLTR